MIIKPEELAGKIGAMDCFLILASHNYALGIMEGDKKVTLEIQQMKQYPEKPLVLVWYRAGAEDMRIIQSTFRKFRTNIHETTYEEFLKNGDVLLKEIGVVRQKPRR